MKEVLVNPIVQKRIENVKCDRDIRTLEAFHKMLVYNPNRAFYGLTHVLSALNYNAIKTLLINDSLFRSTDNEELKNYVDLVDLVRHNKGIVKIFSSNHISGKQLKKMTGIAAILRFPIDEPLPYSNNSEFTSSSYIRKQNIITKC